MQSYYCYYITFEKLTANTFLQQMSQLVDGLLHLSDFPVSKGTSSLSMSTDFRKLMSTDPLDIILPIQNNLLVRLQPASTSMEYQEPFPSGCVTIQGKRNIN